MRTGRTIGFLVLGGKPEVFPPRLEIALVRRGGGIGSWDRRPRRARGLRRGRGGRHNERQDGLRSRRHAAKPDWIAQLMRDATNNQ